MQSDSNLLNCVGDLYSRQLFNKGVPGGWEHILKQVLLLSIGNGRVLDSVQGQLFQIPDVELPPQGHVDEVQGDA